MAKTPKLKKRPVSLRSRAARRGASPSINTDKSLKSIEPPVENAQFQANVLAARDGGITKKRKQKHTSRQQRLRYEKGLERADRNLDKLGKKLATSVQKGKRVKARRANWDELNGKIAKQTQPSELEKPEKDSRHEPMDDELSIDGDDAATLEKPEAVTGQAVPEIIPDTARTAKDEIL